MTFSNPVKEFWIPLVALVVLHSVISFAAFHVLAVSTPMPGDGTAIDVSTPEERASGHATLRIVTSRKVVPWPVMFYIVGGFAALGTAVLFQIYQRLGHGR
jgi:hypothetical protein